MGTRGMVSVPITEVPEFVERFTIMWKDSNITRTQMATRYRKSERWVYTTAVALGLERKAMNGKIDKEAAKVMYEAGDKMAAICSRFDATPEGMRSALRRAGVILRPAGRSK